MPVLEEKISNRLVNQYKVSKIFMNINERNYKPVYILHLKNESPYFNPIMIFTKNNKVNKCALIALNKYLREKAE